MMTRIFTLLSTPETAQDREMRECIDALAALEEPHDEVGFLARVSIAGQIAGLAMREVHIVPVERGPNPLLFARTGAEFLRLARTARIQERFACEWESRIQALIPPECGLRFYLERVVNHTMRIGFRFGGWDTAQWCAGDDGEVPRP